MRLAMRAWLPATAAVSLSVAGLSSIPEPTAPVTQAPSAKRIPGAHLHRPPPMPVPIEHQLRSDSEFSQKARRKAWFRDLHKTPEGVDWKAIERENGLQQIEKRNQLARYPVPPDLDGLWVERGSDNQAGRSHTADRTSDGMLYVGSALGGVWRGTVDGEDWTPIGDDLYGGAHQLVVTDSDAMGEPPIVLAAATWGRVHYSDNDGETWEEPRGLPSLWQSGRLTQSIDGTIWYITNDYYTRTLSRSEDGGQTFTQMRDLGNFDADVWVPRVESGDGAAADTLYVAVDGQLERSTDRGESWTVVSSIDAGAAGMRLAGSEAGAPTFYAAISNGSRWRLHRSDDAGETWIDLREMNDYWGALAASIIDTDIFAWGGVEVHRTTDGGESFALVNSWGDYYSAPSRFLHADIMGMNVFADDSGGETWMVHTDGGTYDSTDSLDTVDNLSLDGLRISQYYDVLTSSADPTHIAAGAQDQGYQVTQGMEQDDDILQFAQVISGDYGHLSSSDGSHAIVYATYPGYLMIHIGEDDVRIGWGDLPSWGTRGWLPMVTADPDDAEVAYLIGDTLARYTRAEDSDYWDAEPFSDQRFGDDGYEHLSVMVFAPTDSDRVYGATNAGRFFVSDDHAETWTESPAMGPESHYYYGTAIAVSPSDRDIAYAGGNGYSTPAVYRTRDGGQTWEPWSEGLPETMVYGLTITRDGEERVFAATETSAYARGPEDDAWVDITGTDAPVTLYWSVETLAHENTVRFGTYGRGIWDFQMTSPACYPAIDHDEDGADCNVDCDDTDPTRVPGSEEVCGDGVDQDCDGADLACADTGTPGSDLGGGDGGDGAHGDDTDKKGCGCSAGVSTTGLGWGLLALGLAVAGRRRK